MVMVRSFRGMPVIALFVTMYSTSILWSQAPLPNAPVPIVPGESGVQNPAKVTTVEDPTPFSGQPLHTPEVPFFGPEPLIERLNAPAVGAFASLDALIVGAHINNRLINTVLIGGTLPDTVQLPSAELGATVSPRFELGYRLPEGFGEFLVSYRFLVASGTDHFFTDLGLGRLKSEMNLNVVDLDYASREFCFNANNSFRWRIGTRLAGVYFNSNMDIAISSADAGGGAATQRVSNNFFGAGPHLGLDLYHKLSSPGATAFVRLDAASVLGTVDQSFGETFTIAGLGGQSFGGAVNASNTQVSPMLGIQFGVAYNPPWWRSVTYSLGYQFEEWWSIGRAEQSNASVTFQGIFFRTEFLF
jgi:hypothetical protein